MIYELGKALKAAFTFVVICYPSICEIKQDLPTESVVDQYLSKRKKFN